MPASLDDILSLLNKWKDNGNNVSIVFEQRGQTNFEIRASEARALIQKADRDEIVFLFGNGLCKGSLVIQPLDGSGLVFWEVINPQNPLFFGSYDPNLEACIKFSWYARNFDYCIVCALPIKMMSKPESSAVQSDVNDKVNEFADDDQTTAMIGNPRFVPVFSTKASESW